MAMQVDNEELWCGTEPVAGTTASSKESNKEESFPPACTRSIYQSSPANN